MPRNKEEWHVLHCSSCKAVVSDIQKCCHRYLCNRCHMQQCAIAPKQAEIEALRRLARKLHMALKQVLAGEALTEERKEILDECVDDYLGPNYKYVVEEK